MKLDEIKARRQNYVIAEELRLIANNPKFVNKYPKIAKGIEAIRETYLARAEEK